MVASEEVEKRGESEARVKAAAWAWYQRSGGSVTPTAGRSEVFATRCATRRCTSRFQREVASRLRALASVASTASDSALTSFSSIDYSSSVSQCTASFGDATEPDESLNLDRNKDHDTASVSLDLVALHPTACWDCGSSLFDSFELVAMSKQLDAELHEPHIDAELGLQDLHTGSSLDLGIYHKGLQQQQVLPLCNTPYNSISPPSSPPRLCDSYETYDTYDTYDKLISAGPDMQSKQAVYDMFCQYGDASKHVTKLTNKRSPADAKCGKKSSGRMSFHALAKALHNIRHPSSHSDNGVAVAHDHHHHLHPPYSPHQQGKALSMQASGAHIGGSRLGKRFLYDDAIDKGHRKEKHIHHHHHHHYHYLFHSDDDFHLQSLDKSLMVAAAGLRSPKVNPVLSSYLESPARADLGMDYGRKWADLGSPVAPNFQ